MIDFFQDFQGKTFEPYCYISYFWVQDGEESVPYKSKRF